MDNLTKPPGNEGPAEVPGDQRAPPVLVQFRWPLVVAFIAVLFLLAFWLVLRTSRNLARDAGKQLGSLAAQAESIAAKFKQGTITTTFLAALPEITSTGMGNLEVAQITATETLRTEDTLKIFGDRVSLGTTVSEIRAPVTYRYYLRLSDRWQIDVSNQTCVVYAPSFRPSMPPAIHTDRMEKQSESGWARFNRQEQLDTLERSLTPTLMQYARDPKHRALVREECRKAVAEFVRNWLLREDHWRQDRFHNIQVIFPDDPVKDPAQLSPVIRLN
jgi:hypothetical protein